MLVKFEMYRSKNKDELIDSGSIQVDITQTVELERIDEVILNVLDKYRKDLPIIKKYGTAYIGKVVLDSITITDNDTAIDLTKEGFEYYISNIIPNLKVIWNKTTNDTTTEEKSVKMDSGTSQKVIYE